MLAQSFNSEAIREAVRHTVDVLLDSTYHATQRDNRVELHVIVLVPCRYCGQRTREGKTQSHEQICPKRPR